MLDFFTHDPKIDLAISKQNPQKVFLRTYVWATDRMFAIFSIYAQISFYVQTLILVTLMLVKFFVF